MVARTATIVGPSAHPVEDFGRDHHLVAPGLEDAAQQLLGGTPHPAIIAKAVDVGAVDEVDSGVDGVLYEPPDEFWELPDNFYPSLRLIETAESLVDDGALNFDGKEG